MLKKGIMMSVGIGAMAFTFGAIDAHAAEQATVTTAALNVRSGPGVNNSIIGTVYSGNTLQIVGSSNGWYNVKLSNGRTGWVSGGYVKVGQTSTQPTSGQGTVTTAALNVRSGPGVGNSVIGALYKGNTVQILGSSNGWYNVKLSNGRVGWASGSYITVGGSQTPSQPTVTGQGTVTTAALNVRSGPSVNNSVIAAAYRGNTVQILGSSSGWYNVKLSSGVVGWASSSYISTGSSQTPTQPPAAPPVSPPATTNTRQAIVNLATAQIGKPYVWGAEGPNSFDCSGLVKYVYKNAANITVPRTSSAQSAVGTSVSFANLQPGDLVFSSTNGTGNVSHVGIYVGNGQMIHAPAPGSNVQKVNITSGYWKNVYLFSKRVAN